ncbi:AMP-binding protein, partial [Acinetobacter baumannii]
MYGLTETSGGITVLSADDHAHADSELLRSCGKPIDGVDIRIVDANGKALAAGEVGEIVCRTVKNMKGYWRRDKDTAQ